MYLTDKELKKRLPEINFECSVPSLPFDEAAQLQSCSIDLRLNNVFWEFQGSTFDFSRKNLPKVEAALWKKRVLKDGETLTIKPGQFILGATYEKFSSQKIARGK